MDKFTLIQGGGRDQRDVHSLMLALGREAREAARAVALAPRQRKSLALMVAAGMLRTAVDQIVTANTEDMAQAKARGASAASLDRLMLEIKLWEEREVA